MPIRKNTLVKPPKKAMKTIELIVPRDLFSTEGECEVRLKLRVEEDGARPEGTDDVGLTEWYTLFEAYLRHKNFSADYRRGIHALARTLIRYEHYRRVKEDASYRLDFQAMSEGELRAIHLYLHEEYVLARHFPEVFESVQYPQWLEKHDHPLQQRGENTVSRIMMRLRAVLNWLHKAGYMKTTPFKLLNFDGERYGTPFYLNVEERNKVATADLHENPRMELVRDIFVFQCLTGCRIGDLMRLTEKNILDGNILEYEPHKTRKSSSNSRPRIPLSKGAQMLVAKYRGRDARGRLFPYPSPLLYNAGIRKMLELCGITREVMVQNPKTGEVEARRLCDVASSHMARRTFVGAAYRVVKDPALIGRMSGHAEGSRAFARYRQIEDDLLREVIEEIE